MASKSNTEVIIGGKVYTLSGYEGEEYLQRVAVYINNKINEFNEMEEFRRFTVDMKATLIQLESALEDALLGPVDQKQQQEENPVFDMTSFEDMLDDVLTEPVPDTAMVKPSGSKHKKGKK